MDNYMKAHSLVHLDPLAIRLLSVISLDVIKKFIRALGRGFQLVFVKSSYYMNQTEVWDVSIKIY